jgi:glutathionylspermidine amidase/synthetase
MLIHPARQKLSTLFISAALAFVLNACAVLDPGKDIAATALPEACQSDCVTPYGQVLGAAPGTVTAYSNCNAKCVVVSPNKENGTYTGIKWQCVEFARRWLLDNQGVVYGDVDTAADIWNKIQSVTRVADNRQFPLQPYLNGSPEPPQVGDLLIYAKEYLNTGHVAVVTEVDLKVGVIRVAEQNFLNQKWPANTYARQIDTVRRDGKYWVLDAYLLGWKRAVI